MGSLDAVPYWHYNVPDDDKTAECPAFLANLSEKDRRIVGSLDSAYTLGTWDEVCAIVAANRLELFQRTPSQLRRYKAFSYQLAQRYGSVADFILAERLQWQEPVNPKGAPFRHPDDIKILCNDWPYGLDPRIVHLVVWTKFGLEGDPVTGDLTPRARADIDAFVWATFCSRVPRGQAVWLKNWSALKSIHAMEHFHVMMLNPDAEFIQEITGGDVPLAAR